MRNLIFTLFVIIFCFNSTNAQSTYSKQYRAGGQTDYSRLSKTKDRGYIQIGHLFTPRDTLIKKGIVITKFDKNTNVQWAKLYNDSSWYVALSYPSASLSIDQLEDGNYIAGCVIFDIYKKQNKFLIFKIDSLSRVVWSKAIAIDSSSGYTMLPQYEMKLIADNKIIVTGNLYTGVSAGFWSLKATYVLKMSLDDAQVEWFNVINLKDILGNSFENTSVAVNGDVITLCGALIKPAAYPNPAEEKSWLVKYNTNGVLVSNKFFDIGAKSYSGFGKIITTSDNGYLVTGTYYYYHKHSNMSVVKFDAELNVQWMKGIGKLDNPSQYHNRENGHSIYNDTIDSSYIIGGTLNLSRISSNNGLLLKLDKNGHKIWFNELNNLERNAQSSINDIYKTEDGGYLTGGSSDNRSGHHDYFLLTKFDRNGSSCYYKTFLPDSTTNVEYTEINKEIVSKNLLSFVSVSDVNVDRHPDNYELITNCASSLVLPITLLNFNAEKNGKANLLKWSTSNDFYTDRFIIEKSNDGNNFSSIALVKNKAGSSGVNEYSFVDAQPLKDKNFYHLKMIDRDGQSTLSKVVITNNNTNTEVSIYGNPVKSELVLRFNNANATKTQINIVNAEGKLLYSKNVVTPQGISNSKIPVAFLANGQYFIKVITPNEETNLRFMKY